MAMPIDRIDEILEEKTNLDGFIVDDIGKAVWADQKVRDAELKMKEIDKVADEHIAALQAKIDKLNEWREEAKKPYMQTVEFFKGHLLSWLAQRIQEQINSGAKKIEKTIKLPFRTLQARSQQPQIVKDDDELLVWATENATEYVEMKPKLNWSEFKKTLTMREIDGKLVYVDENGEVVPHVKLIPRGDVLDWKVTSDE